LPWDLLPIIDSADFYAAARSIVKLRPRARLIKMGVIEAGPFHQAFFTSSMTT
jgi:hypothetical protein